MPRTRNTRSHRGSVEPTKRPLQDITHRFVEGGPSAAPRIKSPLPPSSPPSVSSPALEYVDSDFNSKDLVLKTRVGSSPPSRDSDPFGFFAAEKKLKTRRVAAPAPRRLHKLVKAPLQVTHVEYPNTPCTPKKQRIRPRESGALPLSEVFNDENTFPSFEFGADPGTPSPSKPRLSLSFNKGKAKAEPTLSENVPPVTSPAQAPVLRRSTRRKSAAAGASATEEPKADPPKKKTRSTSSRPKKPVTRKRAVKSKQIKEDPDVKEKLEKERQERVEYFKRLDDYEVAKENVYVV